MAIARSSRIYLGGSVIGILDVSDNYEVDSTKVVTNQQAAIADVVGGGADSDGTARTKINDVLSMLRTHGLIAT